MSRSFKKTPGWCDRNPHAKRQANKLVRRFKEKIPNGRAYRRLYCSWNICDYRSLYFTESKFQRLENTPRPMPRYRAYMK